MLRFESQLGEFVQKLWQSVVPNKFAHYFSRAALTSGRLQTPNFADIPRGQGIHSSRVTVVQKTRAN